MIRSNDVAKTSKTNALRREGSRCDRHLANRADCIPGGLRHSGEVATAADEFVCDLGGAAAEATARGDVELGASGCLDRSEEGYEALQRVLFVDEAGQQAGARREGQGAQGSVGGGIGRCR